MVRARFACWSAFVGGLLVGLCGCASKEPQLRIGAKAGTEQQLLGEILAQVVEKKLGQPVTRLFSMTNTAMAHEALISGQLDVYAEDAVSATVEVLRQELGSDGDATFNLCRSQYAANFQVDWLDPLGLDTTMAIVGRKGISEEIGGSSLTAAAVSQRPFRIGVTREFNSSKNGYSALQYNYNLRFRDAPRIGANPTEMFQWLDQKQIDLVAVEATNSRLENPQYVVLDDDKHVFQTSRTAVLIRQDTRKKHPGLDAALGNLSGKLNLKTIRLLALEVDAQNRRTADVAAGFLRSLGH
jgi:osmoprotectant transport system substrate-binding protein